MTGSEPEWGGRECQMKIIPFFSLTFTESRDHIPLLLTEPAGPVDVLQLLHRLCRPLSARHSIDDGAEVGVQLGVLLNVLFKLLQRHVDARLMAGPEQSRLYEYPQ